jgi:gluconokinase
MVIILMGVSGCGKTAVGEKLAARMQCPFADADQFHSKENIAKMSQGVPLTDADRGPWLTSLTRRIAQARANGEDLVLACSALKASYRTVLGVGEADVRLVHLKGSRQLLAERLGARRGHFFNPALLDSQLETLEEPKDALVVDITPTPEEIAGEILKRIGA